MCVYSYGILIPYITACNYMGMVLDNEDNLDEMFDITKYEEPEPCKKGGQGSTVGSSAFPIGMYRTDEDNINKLINTMTFPITLVGSEKVDGSSITLWYKGGKWGICSRNLSKDLTYKKVIGRKIRWWEWILKILSLMTWKPEGKLIYKEIPSDSEFVTVGKPYLDMMVKYCYKYDLEIALRGELCGKGLRGSGNTKNPHAYEEKHIEFFGIDAYVTHTHKQEHSFFINVLDNIYEDWEGVRTRGTNIVRTKEYFYKEFQSAEELISYCNCVFDSQKAMGRIIEGIVVRTPCSQFSAKIMNLEYDSKK
jgi:hypothetical protein